jgi:hypothetical protein
MRYHDRTTNIDLLAFCFSFWEIGAEIGEAEGQEKQNGMDHVLLTET